jgi:hypothetical protein
VAGAGLVRLMDFDFMPLAILYAIAAILTVIWR